MTRLRLLSAVALASLVATGCVTMSVSSHLERDADFTRYKTWDWGQADALPTGDPRLDNNTIFNDYLQGAVERAFARHGYARAPRDGQPDLKVHYHSSINQRFLVNEQVDCDAGNCRAGVVEYEQGTLVIDVVDARTDRIVWRGWAQDSMQGVIDNQDRLEKQVDEAISKMMARFPDLK